MEKNNKINITDRIEKHISDEDNIPDNIGAASLQRLKMVTLNYINDDIFNFKTEYPDKNALRVMLLLEIQQSTSVNDCINRMKAFVDLCKN